ncbi:Protein CBR-COGC-6.2 [Caenorhabditis briggsae]|uniref:Conserved oligomeric Golgi complex subunit 6 n=1 Tax=Caenorhabditis briggsae TaxID=6238 RepID=A8XDA4_CAEBR|nr:Protein CBR-COGC-6.2 [Caenorhabditis briggsae]CAP30623.2 Protein CBR-COGC-6.2 [Caenorhabditis briggsae]
MSVIDKPSSAVNPLREKVMSACSKKLYNDKDCIKIADFMTPLVDDMNLDSNLDRKLHNKLEKYELRLNKEYLSEFEKINSIVQKFDELCVKMNSTCTNLSKQMETVKFKSVDLVQKTANLKEKKASIETRCNAINEFLENHSLTAEELRELEECEQTGHLSEFFFKVLERCHEIRENCRNMVQEQGHLAAFEVMEKMQKIDERSHAIICNNLKREFQNLTVDSHQKKQILSKAFKIIQQNDAVFQLAIDQYISSRSQDLLNQFVEINKMAVQMPEGLAEPLKAVGDMLTSIHELTEQEKQLFSSICTSENMPAVLDECLKSLTSPFKIRVEQLLSTEKDAVTIFKMGNILIFYADKFETLIRKDNCSSSVHPGINHHVDGLMRKMTAPHYDLLPVPEVRQCLSLYHGLISIAIKTGDLILLLEPERIYEYVLEPLIRTVQLSATRLKSDVDVSVFTINCLTVIRSAISEISAFKKKIEMIDAMIEGNSDVLVSVQVSEMLEKSGILELYQKFMAVCPEEKKPLSTLPGLESITVGDALVKFTQFLHLNAASDHTYDLDQQILASEERQKIRERNTLEFIKVYKMIVDHLGNPANAYENLHYLPIENVESLLKFEKEKDKFASESTA